MRRLTSLLVIMSFWSFFGCGSRETLAEVDFEKSKFGLEYVPDRSLEGYNEKYHPFFQPAGAPSRKYLFNPDDGFTFSFFPKDPALLDGIDVVVIDTIPRTYEKYDRTIALSTLYVDPKLVDRASWKALSDFVRSSYSQPDEKNDLLKWLNYGYNVGKPDSLFVENTIYALVYTNMESLEPVYESPDGKRALKLGVDKGIYYRDNSETAPAWFYTGKLTDSVFYYWNGRAELLNEFGEYENKGSKFKSLYKSASQEN